MMLVSESAYTLRVPGNSGNSYEASYRACSRCSRRRREQVELLFQHSLCSQANWERWERVLKLRAYLFPLFPGTGEG